ncbi:MAG: type II toxin-antitoxin system HicB family antitoxin [Gammaproteobacteria bacterium]|nr:MAG: type II toxin-antitoxin system HicB family antitoxin [Gammaproteobacteria bacterium]
MPKTFPIVIEKCKETGLLVGYVPGVPGAHTQAETLEELEKNIKEVLELILEENPDIVSNFIGVYQVEIEDA